MALRPITEEDVVACRKVYPKEIEVKIGNLVFVYRGTTVKVISGE